MEADGGGGGRDPPMASKASPTIKKHKSRDHYNDSNREIDHQHLASLLRESADLVEKGEFASVLYEALQDFRVYYKQKYPNTGKKKKVSKHNRLTRETSTGSEVTTATKKRNSESSELSNDRNESEENTDKSACAADREGTKEDRDGDTIHTCESSVHVAESSEEINSKSDNNVGDDPDANLPANRDASVKSETASTPLDEEKNGEAKPFSEANTSFEENETLDGTEAASIPVAVPIFTADVSVAPPSPSPYTVPEKSTPIAPVETAMPIAPSGIPLEPSETAASNPTRPTLAEATAAASAQTNNRSAVFGKKFKLGATFKNVKKAAMNVTENITENITGKHHHKPANGVGIFSESGFALAESSGRRRRPDDYRTNDFQSRVTPGKAGASSASSEQYQQQSNNFENNDNQNHRFSHEGENNASSDPSLIRQQQGLVFESQRFVQQQPPLQSRHNDAQQQFDSTSEVPAGESGGHCDSEAEGIAGGSSNSSDEIDPIMEIGGGVLKAKPSFQRPGNKGSTLIANGWIEQFRRSKMRHVWKEVLASLVEGRKPGEVTTLWIQREITNPTTGQQELESLHRIPLKVVQDVSVTEHSTDNQFRLKLYNGTEDFVFRCSAAPMDAVRWVQVLKSHKQLVQGKMDNGNNGHHEEKKAASYDSSQPAQEQQQQQQAPSTKGMAIRDLRAICHGAGVNTAGMERGELEAAAAEVQNRGTYFDQRGASTAPSPARFKPNPNPQQYPTQQQQQQPSQYPQSQSHSAQADQSHARNNTNVVPAERPQQEQQQPEQPRLGIKELRAVCHGAGIKTVGMERRELEAAAREVQSRGTYFASPPPAMHAPSEEDVRARQEEYRRQQEELRRRQESEAAVKRHQLEVEEASRMAAEQEARRQEEARRRAMEEEQRRRTAEEEARRREEAHRRASEEQARRQQEARVAQERYAQQQAAWQQQQQAEQQRRNLAEQQAAQDRRRREEALRKEHEWASPAPAARPQQQWQQQQQQQQYQAYSQQQQQHPPQQQWQQQQQQRPPPPQQQARTHTPPPQQQQQKQHSGADSKYAKMANHSEDNGQATITKIKHNLLIQWALQPPQLQMLRPIAALVTTIHTVFPPALGVSGHVYFKKWKSISREDVAGVNGLPEETKLKKSVRKIRFFLHPDKLPHDLNEEQKFMVKMLWDVTNDSWDEYQKHKEDLDWVN